MSQSLGAYFQCYKNPFSTYKCLESFRKFYPDSTIVLLSNDGYDYSEMAKYFNCIYIHEYESATFVYYITNDDTYIINTNKLVDRVKKVFNVIKEDYIIWLEDDVSVNNLIQDTFKFDINGFSPNKIPIEELQKKYTFLNNNTEYKFSGHGGSVFNKKSCLNYLNNKEIIDDVLVNWKKYFCYNFIAHDLFLSIIVTLNNGIIGSYNGHYDSFYHNQNIIIQHQYKYYYDQPIPENIKHLFYDKL